MCMINERPDFNFHQTTTLTPEQFVAGLTDFGQTETMHRGDRYQSLANTIVKLFRFRASGVIPSSLEVGPTRESVVRSGGIARTAFRIGGRQS